MKKILFIGDSLTDSNRDRTNPDSLGEGFVHLVAGQVHLSDPTANYEFINRGVGGDVLQDLVDRFERDCLNLDPDLVTVLIGVNDTWENMSAGIQTSEEEFKKFESNYRYLLKSLYERTDAKVVLMEPFVLPTQIKRLKWRPDLDRRIDIIRNLAKDYQTEFIPLDGLLYAKGLKYGFLKYVDFDGVHLTRLGNAELARLWLETYQECMQD